MQTYDKTLQVSISTTFYEQLLRQNPFTKKITNPNCKHIKAAKKRLYKKAAHKILVKLTPAYSGRRIGDDEKSL
jgi:hypothetical protein